ncbi:Coenzyme F420 hydrogenase/dehydrogenase, beta subunit C terminus [Bacteroides salyersiae]|nr:Coenzyme F420 hydrogenase/dehydrogenase, beta subunit C terminus [Bacteroides salyersiae]
MHKIELCDIDKCTQCYACVNSCPKGCVSMVDCKDGFKIPYIDRDVCVECGACMKVCHRLTISVEYRKPMKTFACWTKILSDRERSSSGGAFSVLAREVLSERGIVFGASMCEDLKVRHISIEAESDIILLQGSKYLQSYLGDSYKQVKKQLQTGRLVLFTGTPCQIGGLLTYLKKAYENLLTCDVVCHGVPSQEAFDIYIDKIGIRNRCKNFNFRFTKGWGFQLSKESKSIKEGGPGKQPLSPKNAYYLRAFISGLMFSEACYDCAYARPERVSDFTLADYWGLGVMKPFNYPTRKGVSLMLVNSRKGEFFINECRYLFFEERPFEEAVEGNHNLSHTSKRPLGRDTYFEDSKILTIYQLSQKYGIKASFRDYLRLLKQTLNSMR